MKYHVLFSLKNNEKYSRMLSAAFVIGALKVKEIFICTIKYSSYVSRRVILRKNIVFPGLKDGHFPSKITQKSRSVLKKNNIENLSHSISTQHR